MSVDIIRSSYYISTTPELMKLTCAVLYDITSDEPYMHVVIKLQYFYIYICTFFLQNFMLLGYYSCFGSLTASEQYTSFFKECLSLVSA